MPNPDSHSASQETSSRTDRRSSVVTLVRVVVVLSCIASFLTLFAKSWWVADLCANLRLQWMLAIACGAIVFAISRRWKMVAICLLVVCLHLPTVISSYGNAPSRPADSAAADFSVATFNVLTSNQNYEAIERQLMESNADIVAIVELSDGLERHLAGNFAKHYPWSRTEVPRGGNFGIGLYSKHEWRTANVFRLNDPRLPSIDASLTIKGTPVYFVATHTLPPIGEYGFLHRNRHLELLANRINQRKTNGSVDGEAVVVVGDFNLTPWSPHFDAFCNQAQLARNGQGIQPTWYALPAFPFGLVLDHVLTSPNLNYTSHQISSGVGSDHRMVTVDLTVSD